MHWTRVKTILIIVFLVIDLVLISSIIMTSYSTPVIDDTLIEDTISILERNGIKVEKSVVPKTIPSMGVAELKNVWTDNDKAAMLLTGGESTKSATFSGSEFYFTNTAPSPINVSKTAYKQAFETMGIYANENYIELANGKISARQSIDGNVIFETGIFAETAEGGGIAAASGYWILSDSANSVSKKTPAQLAPVTSILINFTENPYKNPVGEEITLIETGYSLGTIYRDTQHKLVSVIPAYKLTCASGYYMYDASTGDFLYANIKGEIMY